MTAQKPPDKTLVGMPADLKAVLEKLDQATADGSAFNASPRASTFEPTPARRPPPVPRSAPPQKLPPARVAPPAPAMPAPTPTSHDPAGAIPMDRTLIGMPSDMQAALARAIAEQANAPESLPPAPKPRTAPPRAPAPTPPSASGPALRAQPVRAIGVGGSPGSEAQVPVQGTRGPAPVPKPTAPASYQAVPPRAAPTYSSGLGYQSGPAYQDPSRPMLAPQAPLDWPPTARHSEPGLAPVRLDQTADAGSEQELLGTEATELALSADGQLDGAALQHGEERSRLALPLTDFDGSKKKGKQGASAKKRWILLAVGGLSVAALAGVGMWLGPKLLSARSGGSENAGATAPTDAPTLPATANLPSTVATDTSAATDPVRFTPTPTRPPAAPAMTSGASAQLEKKAIERLIANDYATAKQLYEKLRSAEPTRPEFGLMFELLNRAGARGCGQPGQAPCAGVEP